MKDILLTADLKNVDSISFSMQSKLLYSINNWIISDSSRITIDDIHTVYVSFSFFTNHIHIHHTIDFSLFYVL